MKTQEFIELYNQIITSLQLFEQKNIAQGLSDV